MSAHSRLSRNVIAAAVSATILAGCSGPGASSSGDEPSAAAEPSTSPPATEASPSAAEASTASAEPSAEPSPEADLQIAVIGDSIPYGRHFCGGCPTFVDIYAEALRGKVKGTVSSENLSTADNLTGDRLVDRIMTDVYYRERVAAADLLIVTIGHNDQPWNAPTTDCGAYSDYGEFLWKDYVERCVQGAARRHASRLTAFLDEAKRLRGKRPTTYFVTTDFNDVISTAEAPPIVLKKSTEILNAHRVATCRAATAAGAACVDVYTAFNGADGASLADDLLAPDHTHPAATGQRVIARALLRASTAAGYP